MRQLRIFDVKMFVCHFHFVINGNKGKTNYCNCKNFYQWFYIFFNIAKYMTISGVEPDTEICVISQPQKWLERFSRQLWLLLDETLLQCNMFL
jgi:hypothetical protein